MSLPNRDSWQAYIPHHDVKSVYQGVVINYGEGGLQNGRGRQVKFYPYEKGGRKMFSHVEGGGGTQRFGVVFTR